MDGQAPSVYDAVIVLGMRFAGRWGLRRDLKRQLDKAAELYRSGKTKRIIVSGRWTIWFDLFRVKPPITEAALMSRYLKRHGVDGEGVIRESRSKDTVGNVYYVKRLLKSQPDIRQLLVIYPTLHDARIRFLFQKFFGPGYKIEFCPMDAPHFRNKGPHTEAALLAEERLLLADVRDGHEEDLHNQLYSRRYYRRQAQAIEQRLANIDQQR